MRYFCLKLAGIFVLLCLVWGCSIDKPDSPVPESGDMAGDTSETEIPGADVPLPDISEPDTGELDVLEPDIPPNSPEPDDPDEDVFEEDTSGNEQVPVVVENNAPQLVINELRTEWASSSFRAEYIEFRILSTGNMDGLQVFIAGFNPKRMVYEFLPVGVKTGEYVVLHLRTLQDSCKNEYGDKLDESGGVDSSPAARDFWVPGSQKLLHKTDAVYVLDKDGNVLDAVMLTDDPGIWLKKSHMTETAEFLFSHGAWKAADGGIPGSAEAVDTSAVKSSFTRSISRDETKGNTRSAVDWYITDTYEGTPGQPNTPRRPAIASTMY